MKKFIKGTFFDACALVVASALWDVIDGLIRATSEFGIEQISAYGSSLPVYCYNVFSQGVFCVFAALFTFSVFRRLADFLKENKNEEDC